MEQPLSRTTKEVLLPEDRFAISIDSGLHHTCAVLDNGEMYCWGRQNYGNMGTGKGLQINADYWTKFQLKLRFLLINLFHLWELENTMAVQ